MPKPDKIRAHYVLSTHWDREWYQSFQNFRYQLVRLLDRVVAGLEDGRLRGPFQTDGQAIILEDYLEIRPEMRARLEQLAQAGRMVIGPWYVLPDEFLVSGESLVRNLRLGRSIARSFGADPSNAGFVCDLFGHNSQMPQIFAGFGIHGALIWRGLNHLQTRHVRWRSPDGTEIVAYRFPEGGYCDYTFDVRHAREHQLSVEPSRVADDTRAYLRDEAEHTEVDPILLFDGGDHEEWDQETYAAMFDYADKAEDEFEIVHTSLDAYLAEVVSQAGRIGALVEGELREPGTLLYDQQWVIPGVLSSRVWIKQLNALCETLLCTWAEPTAAWAHLQLGKEVPHGFLDTAWRWLLKNHPHDSICGCSIDLVHEDMKFRFSQAKQIAERLTREATLSLAANVAGSVGDNELRVAVFNPITAPITQSVELDLQIPVEWPTFNEFFGFEPKPSFRIFGPDGAEIPYQRLRQTKNQTKTRVYATKFPQMYPTHDVRVSLPLNIPAAGYVTLTVRAGGEAEPTRYPATPSLATSERSMENEHIAVTIQSNGSLTLLDKHTGAVYERLLTFEDSADIGDGWYYGMAANDEVFTSTASAAAVSLVHDGPYLTAFCIRTTMKTPRRFVFDDTMRRTEEMVELEIESTISLRPGAHDLEVETTVYNIAEDHRLRVLFPSGARADTYLADTPFDVVERPIALAGDNHLARELEVETKPQQSWTSVFDDARGLAVVSTGLMESAVRDNPERTVALTLLRSTRRTVGTNGEPNGLLLGASTFKYRLAPLGGSPDRVKMFQMGQQIAAGFNIVQLRPQDMKLYGDGGKLPPAASFLQVEGDAVVTSARMVGEGFELRCFNPTDHAGEVALTFGNGIEFARLQFVDLESKPVDAALPIVDGKASFTLAPRKIATLRFD